MTYTSDRYPNPQRRKIYFRFLHIFLYFFNRLNIIRSDRQKYGLIGKFRTFKKMWLLPTDIQPHMIRSDRQKYVLIGNFKTFKKMGLLPTDIQTQRRKYFFLFFHIFLTHTHIHTQIFSRQRKFRLRKLRNIENYQNHEFEKFHRYQAFSLRK